VAAFLTPAWISDLDASARTLALPADLRVVVQQVVRDEDVEVAYVVEIAGGQGRVRPGRAENPDVSFTQDRATAVAIAQGTLSAQAAFLDGRVRLGGDLRSVLNHAAELAVIGDAFATVRATTTW
jgi:putative sterol carrier protein